MNDRLRVAVDNDHAQQVPTNAFIYYQAACATGTAGLAIAGQARHAIDAAIALYRYESQLSAIQTWTGKAFEWSWCPHPPTGITYDSALNSSTDDAHNLLLNLPAALDDALSAPPKTLATHLQWPQVDAVLVASQFHLCEQESQMLEAGGAVLLTESMRGPLQGLLRRADEPARFGRGRPVTFDAPDRIQCATTQGADESTPSQTGALITAPAAQWFEVRIPLQTMPRASCFHQWYQDELTGAGREANLWYCANSSRLVATGELIPWADGWAFALADLLPAH